MADDRTGGDTGSKAPPADAAGGQGVFTRPQDLAQRPDPDQAAGPTNQDAKPGRPAVGGGAGMFLVLSIGAVVLAIVATTCLGAPG